MALTDNLIPHEKRAGDDKFTRYFIKHVHGFIAMSGTVEKDIRSLCGKPVITIQHPINDNLGDIISKVEARKTLGLEPAGRYILFFGLVRKYKGLDLLLDAMAEAALAELEIKLIVAGEFYDDPTFYQKKIEELGLSKRVIIRNEFIPSEDIPGYFCAADLITQTYRTATQSGITQMAYHFNAPMLVTNVGGLPEMVPDGRVGYVVEKKPKDIAKAIEAFFTQNRFEEFSQNVAEEKKKYSWKSFAERAMRFAAEEL